MTITIIDRINLVEMAVSVGSHDGLINTTDGDLRTAVMDLLANLRHYCDANHIDFDDVVESSEFDFNEERA